MKFNDVRDLVLSKEIWRRELGESPSFSVLHIEAKGINSTRGYGCGKSKDRQSKYIIHRSFHNSKTIVC